MSKACAKVNLTGPVKPHAFSIHRGTCLSICIYLSMPPMPSKLLGIVGIHGHQLFSCWCAQNLIAKRCFQRKNTEISELRTLIISTSWSTPLSPGKMGCPKISSALAFGCLGSQSFCCNFTHTSTQISSLFSNPQGLTETQAMDQISITSVPSNL